MYSSSSIFNAKISKIESNAVYKGTVYDQTVELSFKDQKIQAFDLDKEVSKENLGEECNLVLGILQNSIKKEKFSETGFRKPEEPDSEWSYNVKGIVKEINPRDEKWNMIIEVKENDIITTAEEPNFSEGDKIYIENGRIDIKELKG